ncbi:MAG: hypothetical protein D6681_23045 [Calditrichaeota bacterium]|nr:MAG: hypothetical protein D6681_23045 [Calditrichota bacterium]
MGSGESLKFWGDTVGSAVCKMFELVEVMASEFERIGRFDIERFMQKKWWNGEYGFYIKCCENKILWFGIWAEIWSSRGYPICVGVEEKWGQHVVGRFQVSFPSYERIGRYGWLVSCLEKELLLGDPVKNVREWLMNSYLNNICEELQLQRIE